MQLHLLPRIALAALCTVVGLNGSAIAGGDGCGCAYQPPCKPICHHYHRCHRCDCCPPTGVVVPSAPAAMPVAAMPMAAMTFAAAPMQMVAAQAPTYSYAVQAAPQIVAAPKAACGGDGMSAALQEAMVKALVDRMAIGNSGTGGAAAPSAAPAASVEEKLSQLEQKISDLSRLTDKVGDILTRQDARIKALEGK